MVSKKKPTKPKTKQNRTAFGAVSRINTAPVAVGNSIRGSKPRITQSVNGCRVVGRDFAFSLSGTSSSIVEWELIGGMPLTPCAFPSTVLRNYCQMYADFKVNTVTAHYITSSPTSQAGDILFYFEPKRIAPMVDYSNSSFLPFVLSDSNTIIGPQWTNHTALIQPNPEWKTTLYGNSTDLNEESSGSIYLFSKTNSANSPGYVLLDYDITFKNLALNPRFGILPVARAQTSFMCLTNSSLPTVGTSAFFTYVTGKTISGSTSSLPSGAVPGDVYKLVMQITASTLVNPAWTGTATAPTVSNLLQYQDDSPIVLDDGTTFYALLTSTNTIKLFSTIDQARSNNATIEWGYTASATCVVNICVSVQLVTNVDDFQQSIYPG